MQREGDTVPGSIGEVKADDELKHNGLTAGLKLGNPPASAREVGEIIGFLSVTTHVVTNY